MSGGGEGGEQSEEAALVDFGKMNTARIRKATDPAILNVKKKLREARRKLKASSKLQITDEIVFFDDVAGNEQAKVGDRLPPGLVLYDRTLHGTPVVLYDRTLHGTPVVLYDRTLHRTPVVLYDRTLHGTPVVLYDRALHGTPVVLDDRTLHGTPVVLDDRALHGTPVVLDDRALHGTPVVLDDRTLHGTPVVLDDRTLHGTLCTGLCEAPTTTTNQYPCDGW
jgi:hypothetical protein